MDAYQELKNGKSINLIPRGEVITNKCDVYEKEIVQNFLITSMPKLNKFSVYCLFFCSVTDCSKYVYGSKGSTKHYLTSTLLGTGERSCSRVYDLTPENVNSVITHFTKNFKCGIKTQIIN